jgi:hypothetical protein
MSALNFLVDLEVIGGEGFGDVEIFLLGRYDV